MTEEQKTGQPLRHHKQRMRVAHRWVHRSVAWFSVLGSRSRLFSQAMSIERSGDGTITVTPQNEGTQSGLVVLCHGLGDTGESYVDVAEFFREKLPHLKVIIPTAPTQPVTMNMGMPMPSWYVQYSTLNSEQYPMNH